MPDTLFSTDPDEAKWCRSLSVIPLCLVRESGDSPIKLLG
jgi:hypothetical protein